MHQIAKEEEAEAWKKYQAAARRELNAREWEQVDRGLYNSLVQNEAMEQSRPFVDQTPVSPGAPAPKTFTQGSLYVPRSKTLSSIGRSSTVSPRQTPLGGGVLGGRSGVFQNNRVTLEPERLKEIQSIKRSNKGPNSDVGSYLDPEGRPVASRIFARARRGIVPKGGS